MDAAQARAVLAQFVLRARRVEEHSLAADPKVLAALCRVEFKVAVDNRTGRATVVREFPPEELLESVAARVRPITLEKDPVHFNKALAALDVGARGDLERPPHWVAAAYEVAAVKVVVRVHLGPGLLVGWDAWVQVPVVAAVDVG